MVVILEDMKDDRNADDTEVMEALANEGLTIAQQNMMNSIVTAYGFTSYASSPAGVKAIVEKTLQQMREVGH